MRPDYLSFTGKTLCRGLSSAVLRLPTHRNREMTNVWGCLSVAIHYTAADIWHSTTLGGAVQALNPKEPSCLNLVPVLLLTAVYDMYKHGTWTSSVIGPLLSISRISPFFVPTRICPCPRVMARIEGLSSKSRPGGVGGGDREGLVLI